MPCGSRACPAGNVFHCLNRAVARLTLFEKEGDYGAFERVLNEAWQREPIRILDYVVMPNHWHFVLWPETDTQVTDFLRWLTNTHTMRWHAHYGTSGTGHLYQGRFKSFPVDQDDHLYAVLRYVKRNPVQANFVKQADRWKHGSAWRRSHGTASDRRLLATWPVPRPRAWRDVRQGTTEQRGVEIDSSLCASRHTLRLSVLGFANRSSPWFGSHAPRPRGRPKKHHS